MSGVADYLIERLKEIGARALFGLPGGGGNLDLIQAAGRAGLPFVLTATETGSAIAAIAQSEITGAPGVCITTLGPGAASVVNGVACARLDRASLLVVTDSHAENTTFEHQRIDHRALLGPLVKWSGVLDAARAGTSIGHAFDRLAELPPGPVHLDCPAGSSDAIDTGGLGARSWDHSEGIDDPEFQALLTSARKPLLILGLAARRPEIVESIRRLCETRGVPALVTYKAKGVLPDTHEWFAGIFTHGAIERAIVDESDLLIGIGLDPVEILPRPWTYVQPILSIASWQMPDNHVPFRIQQVGHVDLAVDELTRKLRRTEWAAPTLKSRVESAREAVRTAGLSNPTRLTAQDVVTAAAARFAGRARVTVDAGAHMFPATVLWPVSEPNELLISNGLSTMGFALPAAIGAALLDRSRPVIALIGDGGLLICMGELATAVRERLRVITIVFRDDSLSLIEIKQQARGLDPAGVSLGNVDWVRIGEGFGIRAWTARTRDELDRALEAAAHVDGPTLIEACIDATNYPATMAAIRG
jgi:acetolactate synthase I/II/III large subunit